MALLMTAVDVEPRFTSDDSPSPRNRSPVPTTPEDGDVALRGGPFATEPLERRSSLMKGAGSFPNSRSRMSDETDLTFFGWPVHLAFVRSYTAPLEIDWATLSLDTYYGLMYKDPTVAGEFRAFYFRSFVSFTMGTLYAFAFVLAVAPPFLTGRFGALWYVGGLILLLLTSVDLAMHVLAPVSPKAAWVRMIFSFLIAATPIAFVDAFTFTAMTRCDDAVQLPGFTGRETFTVKQQRRICVQMIEPYQTAAIMIGSLGALVYPAPHVLLGIVHLFLSLGVARWVATGPYAHEQPGEIAIESAIIVVTTIAASSITWMRFRSARSAFEMTVTMEKQRREATMRAAQLEQLLTTIVPAAVLPRLAADAQQFVVDSVPSASMLFADMKGFTAWASPRSPEAVTSMLNTIVAALDNLAVQTDAVDKVKTVGDAYWAVSGIPVEAVHHADQLLTFGWGMNNVIASLGLRHAEWHEITWRVGIHSGPMTGALFGARQVSYEVFGETSRIAQLVEANGIPGAVCVTSATLAALLIAPAAHRVARHKTLEVAGDVDDRVTAVDLFEVHDPADDDSTYTTTNAVSSRFRDEQSFTTGIASPQEALSIVSLDDDDDSRVEEMDRRSPSHRTAPSNRRARRDRRATKRSESALPVWRPVVEAAVKFEECFTEAAAEALERPKWRLLPFFADDASEVAFKARAGVVSRNINRICSTVAIISHLIFMASLVAMEDMCFHAIGFSIQVLALVPFVTAVVCSYHPDLSLRFASSAILAGSSIGLIGTGLTSLNGCPVGHEVQAYSYIMQAAVYFPVGPLSWPLLTLSVGTLALPTVVLGVFFSPIALATITITPVGNLLTAMMAFTEEKLMRRRFVEEQLAARGEAQIAALGEERVEVLQRLVPQHIIADLVAWFSANMDPSRSITRSYRRVVIAFMQLRPEALVDLPSLHAEVDHELLELCAVRQTKSTCLSSPLENETTARERDRDSESAVGISTTASNPLTHFMSESGTGTSAGAPGISIIDKIKTVGDILMVAGPFPDAATSSANRSAIEVADQDLRESVDAVIDLFERVRQQCPVRVGVHIGPVVGTVQGSSRLAFDIFGDAVNVASRVLTCTSGDVSAEGETSLHMSAALIKTAGLQPAHRTPDGHRVECGEPRAVEAKGKGAIQVVPVTVEKLGT